MSGHERSHGIVGLFAAMVRVGGYAELKRRYLDATPTVRPSNTTCGVPRRDAFHLFHPASDADSPWPGMLLQPTVGCLWYWCSDQVSKTRSVSSVGGLTTYPLENRFSGTGKRKTRQSRRVFL